MFLALRDLLVSKSKYFLVILLISLVALMSTLLSGLSSGLVDDGISGLRDLPMSHLVFEQGAQESFSRSVLHDNEFKSYEKFAKENDVQISKLGVSFFNAKTDKGETINIAIFGVPSDSFLAPDKRARDALKDDGAIVLSAESKDSKAKVGDDVTIVGPDLKLKVAGYTYTGSYGHVPIAFTSLNEWQTLQYGEKAEGRFSAIAVKSPSGIDFEKIDKETGVETITKSQAYNGSPGYTAETSTMLLIRSFLLVISSLIVGSFFTVWTIQRIRQIGLLKALGASNFYVIKDSVGQLLVILIAGTAIGLSVGLLLGMLVGNNVPFSIVMGNVLLSNGALIVLGLLGSAIAFKRIVKIEPVIAMGSGE